MGATSQSNLRRSQSRDTSLPTSCVASTGSDRSPFRQYYTGIAYATRRRDECVWKMVCTALSDAATVNRGRSQPLCRRPERPTKRPNRTRQTSPIARSSATPYEGQGEPSTLG